MTALSNRTFPLNHTLYKGDYVGRELQVVSGFYGGNVVKDFKIGNTRIKICNDYCHDKTPEAVQVILNRIAYRAYEQLAQQETIAQSYTE